MATAVEVVSTEIPAAGNPRDSKSPAMEVKETSLDAILPEKETEAKSPAVVVGVFPSQAWTSD